MFTCQQCDVKLQLYNITCKRMQYTEIQSKLGHSHHWIHECKLKATDSSCEIMNLLRQAIRILFRKSDFFLLPFRSSSSILEPSWVLP